MRDTGDEEVGGGNTSQDGVVAAVMVVGVDVVAIVIVHMDQVM